jgi:hypothetical protein
MTKRRLEIIFELDKIDNIAAMENAWGFNV